MNKPYEQNEHLTVNIVLTPAAAGHEKAIANHFKKKGLEALGEPGIPIVNIAGTREELLRLLGGEITAESGYPQWKTQPAIPSSFEGKIERFNISEPAEFF